MAHLNSEKRFAFQEEIVDIVVMEMHLQTPKKTSARMIRRNGFTLIELLVVITIVVILIALSMGGIMKAKKKAYEATALNTIRQVASANMSYSSENFGDINVLLDVGDPRNAAQYVSLNYWGRLMPYLFDDITATNQADIGTAIRSKLGALLGTNDPSKMTQTFQEGSQIYHDESGLPVPFAFSNSVYQWNEYKKTTQYDNPTLTLYMSFGFYRFNSADGQTYAAVPKVGQARTDNIDMFSSRTAAFTFLDGHVEILSLPINVRHFPPVP
jgi:prepilin-type N-terminal cleavage/methylation domain-containing protein/prepilin-type processing-associated H-X9-DG protein